MFAIRCLPFVAAGTECAVSISMFGFFSTRLGCIGSIVVSILGTLILMFVLHGCNSGGQIGLLTQP